MLKVTGRHLIDLQGVIGLLSHGASVKYGGMMACRINPVKVAHKQLVRRKY